VRDVEPGSEADFEDLAVQVGGDAGADLSEFTPSHHPVGEARQDPFVVETHRARMTRRAFIPASLVAPDPSQLVSGCSRVARARIASTLM